MDWTTIVDVPRNKTDGSSELQVAVYTQKTNKWCNTSDTLHDKFLLYWL